MKFSILLPTLGLRIFETNRLLESLSNQLYDNFEVIIVSQVNHDNISNLVKKWKKLSIKHVKIENRGLSLARNIGLKECSGDWIIVSDDDCWYPINALSVLKSRIEEFDPDILLTQIYDPETKSLYKNYPKKAQVIRNRLKLMSKSSIELTIKKSIIEFEFDERLGLGAKYVCGEEVDFLLNHKKNKKIIYSPDISVYHSIKHGKCSDKQIITKGFLYAKHFNYLVGILVCFRDLLIKRENNFKLFMEGYNEYNKRGN